MAKESSFHPTPRSRFRRLPAALLALALALLFVGTALAGGRPLSTTLSGAEEVPPADLDGSGTFTATLNQGRGEICYTLTAEDIATPTAAHIHLGAAGTNGGVVVPLTAPVGGSSSECVEVDADLIKAIRQNPENYYVNVHNADYPGGAVRGQLGK